VRKSVKNKTITPDFILQIYKESKKMEPADQEKVVDKLKEMIKYMGEEINFEMTNEIS
jgi:hypothetical protein|tara:strand:+ start:360 stop:533 length:174 start_codon:yes stop_codon:yes gene_type:complete